MRLVALVTILVLAAPVLSQDMQSESIPNSELHVVFPANWTFIRPYVGNGIYSSIHVNLPRGANGGTPAYPEFDFEFLGPESADEELDALLNSELPKIVIGGADALEFSKTSQVRYLLSDMSHASGELEVTGYVVSVGGGHLICRLTTDARNPSEQTKYLDTLKTYCASAIESGK